MSVATEQNSSRNSPAGKRTSSRAGRLATRSIPPALIYEMWNGKPIYYRGYQDVLSGKKSIEEVMSCSDLQGVLVALLAFHLGGQINRKTYLLATNEVGLNLALNDNLGNDLAIFEKAKLSKLKGRYFDVAPKIVVEVDVMVDVSDFPNRLDEYIMRKAQKLLDFGVEKVIWVITDMQKVYIIDRKDPTWYIVNWSQDITVLENCTLNIRQLLDEEEIEY